MGKRKAEKKLEKYLKKIKKIQMRLTDDSLSEEGHENLSHGETPDCLSFEEEPIQVPQTSAPRAEGGLQKDIPPETIPTDTAVMLSNEVLTALGDTLPEQPKFGPKICDDVARIINTIVKSGMKKEAKSPLMEEIIPENLSLLISPKMNLEIATAVGDNILNRDKKIAYEQNQLGVGISILSKTLSSLTTEGNINRLEIISSLSKSIRVLADLHHVQTKARKNLTLPTLDKQFLNLVKDVDRDEYLFGNNLNEKIKAMKYSQKSGNSIKKPTPKQGNYSGPSRYHQSGTRVSVRNGPKKPPHIKNYQQKFPRRTNPENPKQSTQSKPTVQAAK